MRIRVFRSASALLLLLLAVTSAQPVSAQVTIKVVEPATPAELNDLFQQGQKLESQRRWGEALTLYEDALRAHPDQHELEQHVDITKIHYDLTRRYIDSSYRKNLVTLREADAIELYSQVLLKLYSHYVQTPNWAELVQRGTTDLETALDEPAFVAQNIKGATPDQIETFRRDLPRLMAGHPVHDRQEARDAVIAAARLGYQEIGLSTTSAIMEYTCATVGGLDEYSTFLTGDQLTDLYSQIEGNFVGLGIELKAAEGSLLIVNVITGSPAQRGGIKPGDKITNVGGHSTKDLNTDQAAELLQGTEGSQVDLIVATGSEQPRTLHMRREHVEVPSVDNVHIVDTEYGVAYLKLTCFQKTTSRDLDTALWKLHNDGMKSLIIDLRGNPGGLLTSSVEVADKFIDDGVIVSTHGRSPQEDFTYNAHKQGTWPTPLVVLIDGDSASASEIFAGAIRDHHRGTIVGVRSYGKGSVQGIFPLTVGGAGVRLTTAKFYSPTGKPYSHVGVEPDVQVRQAAKPVDGQNVTKADDAALTAGIQAAKQQLAQR